MVQVRFLADVPQHVDQLADWHHAQWQHWFQDWTLDVVRAELNEHVQNTCFPTTLVLLENNQLMGSVSLLEQDAPELSSIGSPWLASLYVMPSARGKGLGRELVRALQQHAKALAVKKLFLFTPEHERFYEKLGWQRTQQSLVRGQQVTVMHYLVDRNL